MTRMFWINGSLESDPAIDSWLAAKPGVLHQIARHWFERMRQCGNDVRETMHDGRPVACLDKYPFAYVNVFTSHVNVGFFLGAVLDDPDGLLEGAGKYMRHVRIRPGREPDEIKLSALVKAAYIDMQQRFATASNM